MWLHLFSVFLLTISNSEAQLAACGYAGCPTGGIWTEWAVTGNPNCSSTCGSCSSLYYTRICVSESAGCNCTGDVARYIPCNTKVCVYPSQKACCTPYLSMVINGSYICGPLPVDKSSNTTSCCPTGGLMSEWTTYGRNTANTAWIRTRDCLTADIGCACTDALNETSATCPCPSVLNNYVNATCSVANSHIAAAFANLTITDSICFATYAMQTTNYINTDNDDQVLYCVASGNSSTYGTPYLSLQVDTNLTTNAGDCPFDRPFDCSISANAATGVHPTQTVSFTCDLETLTWQYDYNGWYILGYNQQELFTT